MNSKDLYLRLLGYVKPYWRMFSVSVLAMLIAAASEPVLPALMQPMLDGSFVDKDLDVIQWAPLALIGLFLVRGLALFVSAYAMAHVGNLVVMDLRRQMFSKLIGQPVSFYDDAQKGQLVATAAYNVTLLTEAATTVVTALVKDVLSVIGLVGWLFWLNWKLALVTFLIVPPTLLVFQVASQRLRRTSTAIQKNLGEITHVLGEAITGHKIVKVFDGKTYERARFDRAVHNAKRYALKQAAVSQANAPIVEFLAAIALAIIVFIATRQAAADETTVGGFVSFMVAMMMLAAPLRRLASINMPMQRGLAAAESVFDLIDLEEENDSVGKQIGRARGELRFERVSLVYESKNLPALEEIDLHVPAGQTIALVGRSGGGKTSLVNLIPRFYQPTTGRILLDGIDLQAISLTSLRANIALVSQEITLFNDSVAANIAYGRLDQVCLQDIEDAAEAAYALDFIRALPQGFDTQVGENGVKLSGGQRQRLAIARALLKDAPILILDEATSALDSESERQVQAALENLMRGRTTLVIAHRLSTIERADRILVLEQGRIVESGKHVELLGKGGVYSRLHALQFREDKEGA